MLHESTIEEVALPVSIPTQSSNTSITLGVYVYKGKSLPAESPIIPTRISTNYQITIHQHPSISSSTCSIMPSLSWPWLHQPSQPLSWSNAISSIATSLTSGASQTPIWRRVTAATHATPAKPAGKPSNPAESQPTMPKASNAL